MSGDSRPLYVSVRRKSSSVKYEQTFISLGEACVRRSMPKVNLKRVCRRGEKIAVLGFETAIAFLTRQGQFSFPRLKRH